MRTLDFLNFQEHSLTDGVTANSCKIEDINGDGHQDFVAQDGTNIYYFQNDGSQNFTRTVVGTSQNGDLEIFDIDGDGVKDVMEGGAELKWHSITQISNPIPKTIVTSK